MTSRSFANRRELEEHHFHPVVLVAVPLCAIFLQTYLPHIWRPLGILDLPLIVVLYFAISWRSRISGTLFGTLVGLVQDLPGNQYIGVNGIAKALIGYAAASIGVKVDVENIITRAAMNFGFCLLESLILFVIEHFLLGNGDYVLNLPHALLRAAVNAAIALPLFLLLDRTRVDG